MVAAALAGVVAGLPVRSSRGAIVSVVAIGRDGWLFPTFDAVQRFDIQRFTRVTQCINDAVGVMKQAGIEVALALTPAKSRVLAEYLPADFTWTPEARQRYPTALAVLRRSGAVVPDLDAVLDSAHKARPSDLLFFKSDTHWTTRGAEPAAIAVAQEIRANLTLPASSKPGVQFGPATEILQETSDLSDLLPTAQQAKYPLITFPKRKIVAAPGQSPLADDDTADTVVIGNSWMQPRFDFAAMLSNQLKRPVALSWRVHQVSPYRNLLGTLGGPLFQKRNPKLVVWNFHEPDMEYEVDSQAFWGQTAMTPAAFLADLGKTVQV